MDLKLEVQRQSLAFNFNLDICVYVNLFSIQVSMYASFMFPWIQSCFKQGAGQGYGNKLTLAVQKTGLRADWISQV